MIDLSRSGGSRGSKTAPAQRRALPLMAASLCCLLAAPVAPALADHATGAYAIERGLSSGLGDQPAIRFGHGGFLMGTYVGAEGEVTWRENVDRGEGKPRQGVDLSMRVGAPVAPNTLGYSRLGWRDSQIGSDRVTGPVIAFGIERPLSQVFSLRVEAAVTDWDAIGTEAELRAATAWRLGDVERFVPDLGAHHQPALDQDASAGWQAIVIPSGSGWRGGRES